MRTVARVSARLHRPEPSGVVGFFCGFRPRWCPLALPLAPYSACGPWLTARRPPRG